MIMFRREAPLTVGSVIDHPTLTRVTSLAGGCDVVELRLDHLFPNGPPTSPWFLGLETPVLITARCPSEGGANALSPVRRTRLVKAFLPQAQMVDIEACNLSDFDELTELCRNTGTKLIASHHDFQSTPSLGELEGIAEGAFSEGADLVKFAFKLNSFRDIELGLDLLQLDFPGPISVMGMGTLGPVSRLLYAQHGSVLNYGYLGDLEAAPGQWPAHLLHESLIHLQPIDPRIAVESASGI